MRRWIPGARGQSMVEFAFVVPVFLLMIFGAIEGGWLLFTYHQVGNAAREGARFAIARGSEGDSQATLAQIQAHVAGAVTGLDTGALRVTADWSGNNPGDAIRVDVAYTHQPIIGMVFGAGSISMSASSTMRFHY